MVSAAQSRLATRLVLLGAVVLVFRWVFSSGQSSAAVKQGTSREIQAHGVIDRIRGDKSLDVHKYEFLQSRMGRDDRPDLFDKQVSLGVADYWERWQKPFITGPDQHDDVQIVRGAIDDLLSFNGWVAATCPTLSRPFGQNKKDDHYEDLADQGHLYYIAIVVHSADHFLVDQLAVIVQLAKRLGPRNVFVSMLDSDSSDSTPTLSDLCEAVLTILGVAFRIRRVPPMTADPSAAYYPLEEATARNLALDPLFELYQKRQIKFHRVVWLKGFTCPTDVLESLRVSKANEAAMVCGMDWAEHNGFFIFSDRWRTRDIEGNLFRQAKSNAKAESGPPRDAAGTARYAAHLPFQVFCCESGSHVIDPFQSYYKGITYRASTLSQNLSTTAHIPEWDPDTQCMDSTQMWFCRDLWTDAARGGITEGQRGMGSHGDEDQFGRTGNQKRSWFGWDKQPIDKSEKEFVKRQLTERDHQQKGDAQVAKILKRQAEAEDDEDAQAAEEAPAAPAAKAVDDEKVAPEDAAVEDKDDKAGPKFPAKNKPAENEHDTNAGTDVDAMSDDADAEAPAPIDADDLPVAQAIEFLVPNSNFNPARILVNPRCVTTYGGVSHTKLALDLFGSGGEAYELDSSYSREADEDGKYTLSEWLGPPDSFVCQEMRTTGGRVAPKSQRRVGFLIQNEIGLE